MDVEWDGSAKRLVVNAVDDSVDGQSGLEAKRAIKIMEDVPCEKLPLVLEGLVP